MGRRRPLQYRAPPRPHSPTRCIEHWPARLPPEYVKRGIRDRAEELCTAQLGFRTQLDALEAERREIDQFRFTSLDRQIRKEMSPDGVFIEQTGPVISDYLRTRRFHLSARLRILAKLGLAAMSNTGIWIVRPDFETVLRLCRADGPPKGANRECRTLTKRPVIFGLRCRALPP